MVLRIKLRELEAQARCWEARWIMLNVFFSLISKGTSFPSQFLILADP